MSPDRPPVPGALHSPRLLQADAVPAFGHRYYLLATPLSQRGLPTPPLALCTGTAMPVKLPGAQRVFGTGESFIPEPAASGDGQPVPGRVP